jgi:anti-sigma B factor antagonist
MDIKTRKVNGVLVVEITGRLDTQGSGPAAEQMARLAQGGNPKILLNLDKLEFISSSGLRVLLRTAKLLPKPEGRMMICQVHGVVKEVLEIAGFDTLLDVHDTEAAGLADF